MRICKKISVLVAGIAIAFSGSVSKANEYDDWISTFTAYNEAYVWVAENELSDLSPMVAHKSGSEAGEGINQIAEDAIVADGERVVVRSNNGYVIEFRLPAVETEGGCAPAFRPIDALGEGFLVLTDLRIERIPSPVPGAQAEDNGGYISFVDGVFSRSDSIAYSDFTCEDDEILIIWDILVDRTVEHSFEVYMSFLADGARAAIDGGDFGAQNEPPAGNYETEFSAFLEVHPSL